MGPGRNGLFLILVVIIGGNEVCGQDPCETYDEIAVDQRRLPTTIETSYDNALCDTLITPGWYRFVGNVGADLFNDTASNYECGTFNPLWMDGSIPSTSDGVVDRTVCMASAFTNCHVTLTIQVKNCCRYRVYNLKPPGSCPGAYCISPYVENEMCSGDTTITATTEITTLEPVTTDSTSTSTTTHVATSVPSSSTTSTTSSVAMTTPKLTATTPISAGSANYISIVLAVVYVVLLVLFIGTPFETHDDYFCR